MLSARTRSLVNAIATSLVFRAVLSVAILATHVWAVRDLAQTRFGLAFERHGASAPALADPVNQGAPSNWDRLVVSRWDSQHYEALGLRGYSTCKTAAELGPGEEFDSRMSCELDFYPTYGFVGGYVARKLHVPVDYAMFGVSLVASFVFLMLWTSRAMTDRLGVGPTYLSLALFNVFTTGFTLVLVQTEPLMLALAMGAYVCFERRWLVAGALLAGAATSIRISAVAVGFSYCAALLALSLRERPSARVWAGRVLLMVLSGAGILALMTYWWIRFRDPLIYAHAHERAFHHKAGIEYLIHPDGKLLMQSLWAEPNEGVFLAGGLLWFALGHREGLAGFSFEGKAFFYTLFASIVGISLLGNAGLAFGGMTRYMITALPLFFAMAAVLKRRPIALALWIFMSSAHYYSGSACFYVGQTDGNRLERCGFARYFRSFELGD